MTEPAAHPIPVPVHITGIAAELALGQPSPQPRRDRVRTRFLSETVDDTNPVRPLLPDDPDRLCAYLETTGGDVYLCGSESDARQSPPAGSVLPTAFTSAWPVRGQGAVWAAQKTAGTTCIISVTADYAVS